MAMILKLGGLILKVMVRSGCKDADAIENLGGRVLGHMEAKFSPTTPNSDVKSIVGGLEGGEKSIAQRMRNLRGSTPTNKQTSTNKSILRE
jgi:hypothetical protein